MEPVQDSVSRAGVEVHRQVVSASSSQFAPPPSTPRSAATRPETSPQQPPKRMTMRERALALREARVKSLSKSAKKLDDTAKVVDAAQRDASNAPIIAEQPAPDNAQKAAGDTQQSEVQQVSQQQPDPQQQSQPFGAKRQGTDSKISKAQGTARAKKNQSLKETSAANSAKPDKALTKQAELHARSDVTNTDDLEHAASGSQSTPPKVVSKASKTPSATRGDRRKRKSTTDVVPGKEGKDGSDHASDVVLVPNTGNSTPLRARKKARVEKSAAPPKAPPKSQKKKKGKHALQPSSTANATVPYTQISADSQQQGAIEAPSKKRKSLRSSSHVVEEGTPVVHDKNLNNKFTSALPAKEPLPAGRAEQEPKLQELERQPRSRDRKSKRLLNRQRKEADSEEPEPPRQPGATVDDESPSKAQTDPVEPSTDIQSPRQTRSNKRRKTKRNAAKEVEITMKVSGENDNDFDSSKRNMTPRRSPRSAAKSKAPPATEENDKIGSDLEATGVAVVEEVESRQAMAVERAAHDVEGPVTPAIIPASKGKRVSPKERALQSVTKSKRFVLSASQQGARFVQPRDSTRNNSRRQSLSLREGLSRLTCVVDQLQREGEAFLEREQRICDQLIPLSSEPGGHKVLNLVQGYVGAKVSDDDRKAIADSALRDAVIRAKLEFQAQQRAVITELAENLVKAVGDWKNSKNVVLRDIIPEELRPETVAPVAAFQQRVQAADGHGSAHANPEVTRVLNESRVDQGAGDRGGLGNDGAQQQAMNANGHVTPHAQSSRRETVAGFRVLENAQDLKQYAGFAYSDLNLRCYRSCAILKLCEFGDGLSYDELYSITPIGKQMLKRKLAFLVEAKYLNERWLKLPSGQVLAVYHTAPQIAGRE